MMCGFSGICPNQLFRPYLNHIWGSIEINCISLSNEFGANVFHSSVERKVKTENHPSIFAVSGVVNTKIFMSFSKLPFYKQTGYSQQFKFLFFGDIPDNQYEIHSGYGCDIYIFWVWEFGIPNSRIPNLVTDLNFGLYDPLVFVIGFISTFILLLKNLFLSLSNSFVRFKVYLLSQNAPTFKFHMYKEFTCSLIEIFIVIWYT